MKRIIQVALVAIIGASAAGTANAGARYYETYAKPIYRKSVFMLSGGWKYFQTYNLGPATQMGTCYSPNTFMVITRPDGTTAYNDNCNKWNKRSCKNVYGTAGLWKVTVFAAQAQNCGSMDVSVGSTVLNTGVDFGGTIINLSSQLPNGQSFAFDTVHQPDGADDTVLLHYGSSWQEKAYSDDDGIGYASRFISQKQAGDRLVVGSWSYVNSGMTGVVINDCLYTPDVGDPFSDDCWQAGLDADRDNLSDLLEIDLLLDGSSHDTDRDGLFDYFEVIGRDNGGAEQELVSIGADPRRRDIFVEVDHESPQGMLSEADALVIVDSYADMPTLVNPDQSSGIAVHMDIGQACAVSTQCGDWGGTDALDENAVSISDYAAVAAYFRSVRHGLFHYMLYTEKGAGGTHGVPGTSFFAQDATKAAHELGHNKGLEHWGERDEPTENRMNAKGAYPSLMNYAYQDSMPGLTERSRFSEGLRNPIDYDNLDETSYSPGEPIAYLGGAPYLYAVDVQTNAVDWNRDGRTNTPGSGANVAFDTAPPGREYNKRWPDEVQVRDVGTLIPTGGGAVAIDPAPASPDGYTATVWAFAPFSHVGGTVYPDYTSITDTIGDDPPGQWSGWTPGVSMAGHPDGEVTATTFEFNAGRRIVLLFPDTSGALHYQLFDPASPGTATWTPVPGWPAGTAARQVSMAAVGTNWVDVVWRDVNAQDADENVYQWRLYADGSTWSAPALQVGVGSYFTPGIAFASDDYVYLARVEPDDENDHRIQIFRRWFLSTGAWQEVTGFGEIDSRIGDEQFRLKRRINLLFVPYREAGGEAFPDGSGYLAVFWNRLKPDAETSKGDWIYYRAYTGGYISPTSSVFAPALRYVQRDIDRPFYDHSVFAARRWNDAVVFFTQTDWDPATIDVPMYIPFATGIPPYNTGINGDFDDGALMDSWMCAGVWDIVHQGNSQCYCDFLDTASCQGYTTEPFVCDGT